jgi:predicted helicase
VKRNLANGIQYKFDRTLIGEAQYRPFVKRALYFSHQLNEMQNLMPDFFGKTARIKNPSLVFTDPTSQKPFMTLATEICPDMHLVGAAAGSVTLARYSNPEKHVDNVTDWALEQFRAQYEAGKTPKRLIIKDAIFHYVYGALHDPIYREKYELNLKRDFPRIPFYADFWRWADWGEQLMKLHIGYENVQPWPLRRNDIPDEKARKAGLAPKAMFKANKDAGNIRLDSETQLTGVPLEAWNYKLGNRSALEWVLDQYKEKTPKDPTIRAKFNNYRFADHKEKVIDLLKRVTRVSVETMKIVEAMRAEKR